MITQRNINESSSLFKKNITLESLRSEKRSPISDNDHDHDDDDEPKDNICHLLWPRARASLSVTPN